MSDEPKMHDSGARQQFEGGAQRDTAEGKPQMHLLSPHVYSPCLWYGTRTPSKGGFDTFRRMLCELDQLLQTMMTVKDERKVALNMMFAILMDDNGCGVTRLCKWLELGAQKYSAFNWAKGMPFTRVVDSYMRHRAKVTQDDEDHLAAMACNVMFLIHYVYEIEDGRLDPKWDDLFDFELYKEETGSNDEEA